MMRGVAEPQESSVGLTLGPFLSGADQWVPRCLHTMFQSDKVTSLSWGTLRVRGTTKNNIQGHVTP